jgi:oxygen-dependent protoporphyrinogen oxidase
MRVKDRGLTPLVLESSSRVGGRMTTDRVKGYAIDTGVTLLGNRFRGMRALIRRVALPTVPVAFSLGLQDGGGVRRYRAQKATDLLLDPKLSLAAKWAVVRVLTSIVLGGRGMLHGSSDRALRLDRETVGEYFHRLGRGGEELLRKVFEPGLRAALGGAPARSSRLIVLQVIWNTLGAGFWNFDGGVDRLPEALAALLPTDRAAHAQEVRATSSGVEVDVSSANSRQTLRARAAILALPGNRVPSIFPAAPDWIRDPAGRAEFSRLASAHVALAHPPACPHAGYGFAVEPDEGIGALELEHLRAPGRCPSGKGMVSVYFLDTPRFRCLEADDAMLREKAVRIVERTFPEAAGSVEFVHLIRWPAAIALFPRGRLSELASLRARLAGWDVPIDLAGDWLDGVSSESAIQTGQQAADRIAARLGA